MQLIGEWNKSVILTYIGVAMSILGMRLAVDGFIHYAIACLIVAGVCDLFDGVIARKMERTEMQKAFGKQLDSLADVFSFVAFPIVILLGRGFVLPGHYVIYVVFALCGIARLAHFNVEIEGQAGPVSHYTGLPVTYTALIFPFVYLLNYVLGNLPFQIIMMLTVVVISCLNIMKIPVKKPRGLAYIVFSLLAVIMLFVYLVII